MSEHEREENLARLIQAGLSSDARPTPSLRKKALEQLRTELRMQQQPPARLARTVRTEEHLLSGTNIFEPVGEPARQQTSHQKHGRETLMSRLFTRWSFGVTAAAGAATIILIVALATPRAQAKAIAVMAKGAHAVARLSSVHLRGQVRSAPRDNFSAIMSQQDFVRVEFWKQLTPLKWRAEKPGRVAVMDGESTVLFVPPDFATKAPPSRSAFDTQWLHEMADLSGTLEHELSAIKAHGWPVALTGQQGADGKSKSVVTVEGKAGLPDNDYLKNAFFMTADTRRVYVFDDVSELLESVRIYVHGPAGDQLVFELSQIDFNQPIEAGVFQLQLPANVSWQQEMQVLPDNDKYAAMTAEQAARAFLEACGREDWTEAGKFWSPLTDSLKQGLGGIQVNSIGKEFTSALTLISGAHFVPYEIKYKDGRIKKWNLALKRDRQTNRWFVDGGI